MRDPDHDVSEKVVLGMANISPARGSEVMYNQRIFKQDKGMDSGFATNDQYGIYGKSLVADQATISTLYQAMKDADGYMYSRGADEQLEKIMKPSISS